MIDATIIEGDEVQARPAFAATRCFRHGWHSFSAARWERLDRSPEIVVSPVLRLGADDPAYALSTRHGGSGIAAVEGEAGGDEVLLVGALCLGARVEWTGEALTGLCAEPPGRWFVATGTEEEVFSAYAQQLGTRFGARAPEWPSTWMSWYSYFDEIDEARLDATLRGLDGLGFQAFVVDDGWERSVGDWEPGPGFPRGMGALAQRIADHGLLPGLWLAPFLAPRTAPVVDAHPEWFIADDAGEPIRAGVNWGGDYLGVDLTHPAALRYVCGLAERAVEWGFRVLKLDFLFAGAIPGRRHREIPREHAYRHAIEAIRAAVGDEVRLLGCGAPIIASLGVFDALRVGPDVAAWWENGLASHLCVRSEPATRGAILTSLHRLWLRELVGCDPDVVYVRERRQAMNGHQRGLLLDLARICGHRTTSDPPEWLDPSERAQLAAFIGERDTDIARLGRYVFSVDGRTVDFTDVVEGG